MKRMMSRNRSERTLASMTDRGEGSEEGLSTSREVPPKPAKLPSDTRTWSERYSSTPGPGSPFYSPPPSSRALRWLLVIYLLHVAVFCGITIGVWIEHHGLPGRLLMLTLFALFSWWRGYQIRALLKELARRRHAPPGAAPMPGPGPQEEEKRRRRRAAWARVGRDLFPLLSRPTAIKRPFDKRNDFKD